MRCGGFITQLGRIYSKPYSLITINRKNLGETEYHLCWQDTSTSKHNTKNFSGASFSYALTLHCGLLTIYVCMHACIYSYGVKSIFDLWSFCGEFYHIRKSSEVSLLRFPLFQHYCHVSFALLLGRHLVEFNLAKKFDGHTLIIKDCKERLNEVDTIWSWNQKNEYKKFTFV